MRRAVLIGHSNGVPVVRQFYREHPEQVAGMLLVDGPLKAMFGEEQATALLAMFESDLYAEHIKTMIGAMPAPNLAAARRAEILSMALEQPHSAVVGGLRATLDAEVWEPDPIEAPLTLLLAEQPAWDDAYEAFVRGLAPQVDYRVWGESAGHFLMLERPEAFNSLVTGFVASLDATP